MRTYLRLGKEIEFMTSKAFRASFTDLIENLKILTPEKLF